MKLQFREKLPGLIVCFCLWHCFYALSQTDEELFQNPPLKTRIIKIVHSLPDKPEEQDNLFQTLKKQGFGGIVCNVSFENYLLNNDKWKSFINGITKAKDHGFSMWLYDERGYPSGNAGGLVLKKYPACEARGLLILSTNIQGVRKLRTNIPAGNLMLAKAFPKSNGVCFTKKSIDLTEFIKNDILEWNVPDGNWQIAVVSENKIYTGTHAEMNLWEKTPYINLLKPEATELFIKLTHAEYARRIGKDLGIYFEATFTDEPSLMSLFLRKMPWKVLPWSDNLPIEFRKRRGYEIETRITSLFLETEDKWKQHRHDFWLTVGELVSTNYFGQIQNWCKKHNLLSGGHLLAEEGLVNHVPLYGDFFRCVRYLDAPSIDCLTSVPVEVPWYIARLVSSVAWLDGKKVIMCETSDHSQVYRPAGDNRPKRIVTEDEIRGTFNRLFVNGITRITSYYSFANLTDEQLRRLNQQCGRCAWLIETSKPSPNTGVLYPVQTIWTKFVPSDFWSREATAAAIVEKFYHSAITCLYNEKQEFMIVDYNMLQESKANNGKLSNSHITLDTIILPATDTISLTAMKNLEKFVKIGGKLILIGSLPENSENEFPSKYFKSLIKSWSSNQLNQPVFKKFGKGCIAYLPSGFEFALNDLIKKVCPLDFTITDPLGQLKITRRTMEDKFIFLIINDSNQEWRGNLEFLNYSEGELWNPMNGQVLKGISPRLKGFSLPPYGMVFLKFSNINTSINEKKTFITPANFQLKEQTIEFEEPRIAAGEFVSTTVTSTQSNQNKSNNFYLCHSTITKSNVDTWMFLVFPVKNTRCLDNKSIISINISIPANQETQNQILLIVKEKDGGDFISETGIYLNEKGEKIARVSLTSLHIAGWSKDDDGILNPEKIAEIRIGWGGYYGEEGECISFKTTQPSVIKLIMD